MFSKACEYGIRASIFIAKSSFDSKRVSPKEISEEIDSPQAFTSKILQKLVHNKIINSVKGVHGGFEVDLETIDTITIAHIVSAIDGEDVYKSCALGLKDCDASHPCPLHNKFETIRNDIKQLLEKTSLQQLALEIKTGISFLKV